MSAIAESKLRVGNFTSSKAVALVKSEKTKATYIEECNFERRLGRSIESESNARPLTWGKMVEKRVFELLGLEYQLVNEETIVHPDFDCWAGTPDAIKKDEGKTVCDIKSPMTLKSFCQLVEPLYDPAFESASGVQCIDFIRKTHQDGEKYYWQLISNAILTGSKFAELIVYVPYKSELEAIQQMAAPSQDVPKGWNWIYYANHDELPYLPDGGWYRNINVIRFPVPAVDKIALHEAIVESSKLLKPQPL
jgi:hypothetical protein